MRSSWKMRLRKWCELALAAALLASPAVAQEAKGSFTLQREVHWSTVTLPPGEYTYSLDRRPGLVVFVRPKDGGAGFFLMPSSVSTSVMGKDQLTIEQRRNAWYVTAMTLKDTGERIRFSAPAYDAAATTVDSGRLATIAGK